MIARVLYSSIKPGAWALFFSLILISYPISTGAAGADPNPFPEYKVIAGNVLFWQKIYSTYSVNTAIIHDQNYLNRVYAIVSLHDEKQPGARRKNEKTVSKIKKYYSGILLKLAKGQQPVSDDEKRVASLLGSVHSPSEFRRAAENIRSQRGLKERFVEGVIRSGAYMREIKRIFTSHGLPTDLAYLPHVESSFNPRAYSKFGAAGMWQFTRTTGREFLRIDYIIDERRDPLISAEAAARFLKRNYSNLGTWPLALTAYNYGPAGMRRALNQEGSYENIFKNYQKGHFKFASRNFYSEFLAAVKIARALEQSGQLTLNLPVRYVTVKLPAYTDAARLSNHLRIDQSIIRRYNPALRKPVFQGTKYIPEGYILRLPYQFKDTPLLTRAPASLFRSEQKRSKFYQVRPGDTAGAIALAHNVTLSSLIRVNNLNRQAFIRVGQNLRIPPAPVTTSSASHTQKSTVPDQVLADNKKLSLKTEDGAFEEDSVVLGNLKVFNIQRSNQLVSGIIEVQPDESIGLFADWLKVTPRSIHVANNMPVNKDIHPGQQVILDFISTSIETFEETRFDFHQEIQEDFFSSYTIIGVTTYKVENGDTIWDICHKKFGVPLWLLKKYNDKLNLNRLETSSNLQIPVLREI